MSEWKRNTIVLVYSMTVTFMAGEWAFKCACIERGYKAIGGEYCFVVVVAWLAYKIINIFLDILEETIYEYKK